MGNHIWHRTFAVAAIAGLTVAACAQQPAAPSPTAAPTAAATTAAPVTQRGAGGDLKILYWQAPTILNPHQATGTKDADAGRIVLEPMAALGPDSRPVARLAAEVPTPQNGGVSADLTTVTWKLKQGVKWSDGTPFTADDVVFTYTYMCNEASATTSFGVCEGVKSVTKTDATTIVVTYAAPTPYFYQWGTGSDGTILQQAQYKDCVGEKAKTCPADQKPIGTGPYKVREFKPGDVILYDLNENYREPNKPYFKSVTFKGGGDAVAAARAAFQTGDIDYAWNLQVESSVLNSMSQASDKATLHTEYTLSLERLLLNRANPDPALGEKRSEPDTKHPFLSDPAVRRALSMATDRATVANQLYGIAGKPTCNVINAPPAFVSKNTATLDVCKFDLTAAEAELEKAGWVKGPDGVRAKGGVRLELLFQTTVNTVRQKTQEIMKANWEKIGFKVTLRSETAATFFTNTSPGGANRFYADVEEFANSAGPPDFSDFMNAWTCSQVNGKDKNWNFDNYERFCSPEYDAIVAELRKATDEAKKAELVIKANDFIVKDVVIIPLVWRSAVTAGVSKSLKGFTVSGWDSEMWDIASWSK